MEKSLHFHSPRLAESPLWLPEELPAGVDFLSRNVRKHGLYSYSQQDYSSRIHIIHKLEYTKPQRVGRRRIHIQYQGI
jgi:hypothetical protein